MPGQDYVFPYPVPADSTGVSNTATVVCDVLDFDNDAEGADSWDVEVIDPSIVVTKTGPDTIKAGDEIIWTISFTTDGFNGNLGECLLNDELLELVNVTVVPGQDYNYPYLVPADATGSVENIAVVTCDVLDFDNDASDDASWTVDLIGPEVLVDKTGPEVAKAGDEITYTISFTTAGFGDSLGVCLLNDELLGVVDEVVVPGTDYPFNYTVPADSTDPVENQAIVACDVLGFDNDAEGDDSWLVEVIDPSIEVTKIGPDDAKAGDDIVYTISFTATGFGDYLGECLLNDELLGVVDEVVVPGTDYPFDYVVPADAVEPIENTATVVCDVLEFDNNAEDDASWTVDVINPGVSLTKECRPDPVGIGETIEWAITVENTGNVELDCVVNVPTASIVDAPVVVPAGGSETLNASRTVEEGDAPDIYNTATVLFPLPDFDNQVDDEGSADCEVQSELYCMTPGFWGNVTDDEKKNSNNLVQIALDAVGGSMSICGATINNTVAGNVHSAAEAMCVVVEGYMQRQLARHLTAAALNCITAGGLADCSGTSFGATWQAANASCIAMGDDMGYWKDLVDDFNNGIGYEGCFTSDDILDSPVFEDLDKKGPAGGSNNCSEATGNGIKVVPADP